MQKWLRNSNPFGQDAKKVPRASFAKRLQRLALRHFPTQDTDTVEASNAHPYVDYGSHVVHYRNDVPADESDVDGDDPAIDHIVIARAKFYGAWRSSTFWDFKGIVEINYVENTRLAEKYEVG